jgi:pantothenate kinase type III
MTFVLLHTHRTSLITLPELKRAYLTPSDALAHHVPNQWRHYFFGGTKEEPAKSTKENAWRCCWNRPIPTIHVYLVTLGACLDDACIYLFSDLPARLYQLSASIFWPDSCFTTPPAQGPRGGAIHQDQQQDHLELVGMEIQRRAGIKAAVSLFGHPALVIDAGSFHGFWNYTATDCNGTMLGGGYAANMAFSWLVLYHATGSLPLIQYSKLMERYPQLTMAAADQAAATATPTVEGKEDASFDDAPPASVFSTSTEEAILADAVLTLGTRCRYIVNHWLHRVGKAEPPVDLEDLEKKPAATTATHVAAAAATTTSDNFTNDEEPTNKPPANSTAAASAGDNKKDNLAAAVAVDQTTTVMEEDAATYSPTAETSKMNRKRCIILTGAEKEFMIRLLQPDYGGVLEKNDDDVTTMPVVHQEFEIHSVKHLLVFAIGQVVYEQQRQHEQVERNSGSEQLRRDLMGLRVAMEFERPQQPDGDVWYRGSVIRINRGADEGRDWQESLDDDLYWIQFDDGDSQELTPFELYCKCQSC